jgi:predicted unusual protein kinase regulating ubiquinone biosynthesis (AarF/ABC1/UbiB family)
VARKKPFVTSRASRFFRLTGLTGRVSSSYTGQRVKELFLDAARVHRSRSDTHVRNAERIVQTLGELKGAVMKVGQYMSIQTDLLPKEYADVLASLQKSAPPVEYERIESVIISEFGKSPEALFAHFDREPHASASIGQVHRARLAKGTEVVVKIQYPEVDKNIEGDLSNLKTILSTGSIMGYRKSDLEGVFAEIRDRLYEELDYDQEMENLKEFRHIFQKDKRIRIPRVFPAYCSYKVLTMEYLPGDPLEALQAPPYTQEDRNRFGELVFDLFAHQILRLGLVHADPHPGNFAFQKEGPMILYDFGCLKRIPPYIREACRDLARCGLQGDYEKIDEALLRLGSRDPRREPPDRDFYRQYLEVLQEPFQPDVAYDFGTSKIHERMVELAPLGVSKMFHFKPSRETVFIGRTIGGHYGNMLHIGARAKWRELLEPYLKED